RRRHTRSKRDWSSDVCSSDLQVLYLAAVIDIAVAPGIFLDRTELLRQPVYGFADGEINISRQYFRGGIFNRYLYLKSRSGLQFRSEERRVGKRGGYRWIMCGE